MPIAVPEGLARRRRLGPAWGRWLDDLPRRAADLLDAWGLRLDGAARHGRSALVLPVLDDAGGTAVLKLSYDGDDESRAEHLALRLWAGDGAVRLRRADPGRRALLLERLSDEDLGERWDLAACEVVAALYPRLHVRATPAVPLLADVLAPSLERLHRAAGALPPRHVDQARQLARELLGERPVPERLLHGDLHYANVLAADRQPWLAIDPKPVRGDPCYEPGPLLWNRWDELAGDVRGGLRRRLGTVVDTAGLDEERVRAWAVVRAVVTASWAVLDARPGAPTRQEREQVTRLVAVVKSVQD